MEARNLVRRNAGLFLVACLLVARTGHTQVAPPLTVLHSFNGSDGARPNTGLIRGRDGAFYGVTEEGGAAGTGTVFKITPSGALTTLYTFSALIGGYFGTNADGANPWGLTQGRAGVLYGV